MKNLMNKLMMAVMVIAIAGTAFTSCKSKPKDADVKAAIETAIQAKPDASGTTVAVDNGVATLSGEVTNEAAKEDLGKTAATIMGVKSVVNNLTVRPAAPVAIAMDDPLTAAVKDATKDFPTVNATVSAGVITLKGEIQKASLQKLMMALQALKPKKVDNTQLVIK
ncbi:MULTISPECIES: BON domain-containing protein [Pedobacter]|uniref:Transport-associated n=1 Tax=Pedobacter heparinus (strain ATCC 13125 / DSM 2366 / CIP 104194 / JCM 7457 / NBRC 12017 / NCIMB 9290 / NRRL B-14731 / HIM 762-3) TaxID=485917 RepID=C6XSW1_PEDHD|nr:MULTISPECIES: BON domain-containing protein [Pedobacter]ACU05674.1 transport-associated [Pedobacter heparinus DSM 2366]MBB5440841.1 osmotically-inducible protein OsmY [Pedobacter sp. AK017]